MNVFISGTDTHVGKTLMASWIAIHTGFSYFKPIQTGMTQESDSQTIRQWSNVKTYPEIYAYPDPVSPHLAAKIQNDTIDMERIVLPTTDHLIIERCRWSSRSS